MALVTVQRLVGEEQAVVQHVEPLKEVGVHLHLLGEPRPLALCRKHIPTQTLNQNHRATGPSEPTVSTTVGLPTQDSGPSLKFLVTLKQFVDRKTRENKTCKTNKACWM